MNKQEIIPSSLYHKQSKDVIAIPTHCASLYSQLCIHCTLFTDCYHIFCNFENVISSVTELASITSIIPCFRTFVILKQPFSFLFIRPVKFFCPPKNGLFFFQSSHTHTYTYYIYPMFDIFPVVFFHIRSMRYYVIFHSCYLMLYCACAFPISIGRTSPLLHSFCVRDCEILHSPSAHEIHVVLNKMYFQEIKFRPSKTVILLCIFTILYFVLCAKFSQLI